MRTLGTALAFALLLAAEAVAADTHIFLVENQPDGYGVDQCLASGAHCGAPVANAYCQSRSYDHAVHFRKVEPGEITAAATSEATCHGGLCGDYVAIECSR